MLITTQQFRSSRAQLLAQGLFSRSYLWVWLLLAIAAVTGLILALCVDWRWALVDAMLMLVLAPGVMALLYINVMFSPRTLPGAYPHTLSFTDTGIELQAIVPLLPDEAPEREPKRIGFKAAYSEVKTCRLTLHQMLIRLKGNPPGIILVPYEQLPDARADVDAILKKIGSR